MSIDKSFDQSNTSIALVNQTFAWITLSLTSIYQSFFFQTDRCERPILVLPLWRSVSDLSRWWAHLFGDTPMPKQWGIKAVNLFWCKYLPPFWTRFDSFLLVYRKTLSSWDCCQLMFHLRWGNTVNYSLQYLPLVIVRFYTNVNLVGFNCIICCHSLVLSLGDRRNTFWTMVLMAFALTALECISFLR